VFCRRPSPAVLLLLGFLLAAGVASNSASAQEPMREFNPDRSPRLRWAVDDILETGQVTDIREPRPGLLRLVVSSQFRVNRADFYLTRLYLSYSDSRPELAGGVMLELFRGRVRIGEYTRDGLSLRPGLSTDVRETPPIPREQALRVFLDCGGSECDDDFLRSELDFVNHVRDRQGAQVLVQIVPQETGGGGTEYTVSFIGQREFKGADDSLRYVTQAEESVDRARQGLADALKRGLVRYVNHTPFAEQIGISYSPPAGSRNPSIAHDPWNFWSFSTSLNGSVNGEASFTYTSLNGSFSANRTTEASKFIASVQGRYNENRVDLSDSSTVTTISRDYSADLFIVRSLGRHLALGLEGTLISSTFLNQRRTLRLAPALEYNFFPYSEATRRQFTLQYTVGANAFEYNEETVFGKTTERLLDQKLLATLSLIRPWGSISTSVEGAHYLQDLDQRHVVAVGNVNLNLAAGFSLLLMGGWEQVKDQLYLSRTGVTDQEILLHQRQLATSSRYWSTVGFSFTFGSPFANVVNPRFGGTSGGLSIIR
jgi:hypothetical protein